MSEAKAEIVIFKGRKYLRAKEIKRGKCDGCDIKKYTADMSDFCPFVDECISTHTILKLIPNKQNIVKKYIAIDAINSDQESFKTIEEARNWLTQIIIEDDQIHPDAESCSIQTLTEQVVVLQTIDGKYEVKFVPLDKSSGISLKFPIEIRPTIDNDGYVITDADDVEHFFYETEKGSDKMDYDGFCANIQKRKNKPKNKTR